MITNISKIEITKGEKVFAFLCDADSPIGEVYDALCQMKHIVTQKIQEIEKADQKDNQDV